MSQHFEHEVEVFKTRLILMASEAEVALRRAMMAFLYQDADLARKVLAGDNVLDRLEMEVDELAIVLMAKAPLASDLRMVAMGIKISHELERVGDLACTIARATAQVTPAVAGRHSAKIIQLSDQVMEMLRSALDAFTGRDAETARAIPPRDKQADALNKEIQGDLIAHMMREPEVVPQCVQLVSISRSLERVGDHAKNLAEDVVYLLEGQDIRHSLRGAPGPAPSDSPDA